MSSLAGWRVLIPRPAGRGQKLITLLGDAGATALAVPLISVEPTHDAALDAALIALHAGEFDWAAFTSVNAVESVASRSAALGLAPVVPADTRVACVGPATTAAAKRHGIPVDLTPPAGGSAAALIGVWPSAREGDSVFLPQSGIARPELRNGLTDKGFRVISAIAYHTVPRPPAPEVAADLGDGSFEAVLLTSPSTVDALAGVQIATGTVIGVIGHSTAAAAEAAGLTIAFVATAPTDADLVRSLEKAAAAAGHDDRTTVEDTITTARAHQ